MYKCLSTAFMVVVCAFPSHGQKKASFTKVTIQELSMTSYPGDSTAGAVILLDLGYFNGNEIKFYRKIRVKVLSKAGLDWGNWTINTPTKSDFKVVTHNLVDGKIVSEKADSKSIHEEEIVDKFTVYKVFAPSVKVGSVVDITYSFIGLPFEWRFQDQVPVVLSELVLEDNSFVKFSKTHFGFQPIETVSANHHWRAHNMPAFHPEPFLSHYSNYITKFEFQIESIGTPGTRYFLAYSITWKEIINRLCFDLNLENSSAFLNSFVKETKAKDLSVKEKVAVSYEYVRNNMKWDGREALYASGNYRERFTETHNGSSSDINLILIALLKKLDVTVFPVALSTRKNGLLVPYSPTISKLNYVIAYVQDSGYDIFLDATSEFAGAPGIIPSRCLNGNGLLVKKDNEQWLSLNKGFSHTKKQYVTVSLDPAGTSTAKVFLDYAGYAYLDWMDDVKASNQDKEILKNKIQKNNPEISVLNYEVSRSDSKTLMGRETLELDISAQLVDAGGEFLLNPFVLMEYQENPFKSETRKYPVDLNFSREVNSTVVIALPKGFSVKELPANIKVNNADGTASFSYLANLTGSNLTFRAVLKITKPVFTESEYLDLRVFFSEVVKKLNAPIELSKT